MARESGKWAFIEGNGGVIGKKKKKRKGMPGNKKNK